MKATQTKKTTSLSKIRAEDSLAVKYRPRFLSDIVGNSSAVSTLTGLFTTKRISKTFLFSGVSGSGKTTCARIVAMTVNCQDLQGINPCMKCPSCVMALAGTHPDIIEINAAGEEGSVDELRKLIRIASYNPRFNYKCFILDECHGFSAKGKQEVLKPLEEPPPNAIWLLCTTAPEKMPRALYGRCLKLFFTYPEPKPLAQKLLKILKKEYNEYVDVLKPFLIPIAKGVGCQPRDAFATLEAAIGIAASGEDIESKLNTLIIQSSELDAKAMKFILYTFNGDLSSAVGELQSIEEARYEEFLLLCYRYCLYILTPNKKQFYGIAIGAWNNSLKKNYFDQALKLCGAITTSIEKIRTGLVSPFQSILLTLTNFKD